MQKEKWANFTEAMGLLYTKRGSSLSLDFVLQFFRTAFPREEDVESKKNQGNIYKIVVEIAIKYLRPPDLLI